MIVIVYDRRGNIICKLKNENVMFAKIPCQECEETGVWNYYPTGYNPSEKDLICIDCKGTGFRFVDLV